MATKKEADAQDRKRRRRKKTGLRVPSDDVPRRATAEGDPRLAVSLAGAFGGAEPDVDPDMLEEEEPELLEEEDEPSVALDELSGADQAGTGDSVDIAFDDEDSEIRDPSIGEAGAVATPVDDAAVAAALQDDIEDVSAEVEEVQETPRTDEVAADGAPESEIVDDGRATAVMPALRDQEAEAAPEPAGAPAEDEPEEVEPSVSAGWEPDDYEDDGAGEAEPVDAIEAEPDEGEAGEAEQVAEAAEAQEEPEVVADDEPLPVVEAEPEAEPPEAEPPEAEQAEDAEAPVEAVGATIEPGDASDSGELLTDDLIEEYDGESAAPAQPAAPVQPAPPAPPVAHGDDNRAKTVIEPVEEIEPSDVVEVGGETAQQDKPAAPPPAPPPKPAPVARPKPPPAPPGTAGGPPRAPRRKGKPWFEEIFDEDYLRTLPFLTPQQTQKQSAFVVDALAIEPGASVLDLGCGYGRHAMELAARGFHVVGLDASLPLLIRGADEAQRRGLTINFVHGDMRELTFESQFDGAYCLFGTFGYFDDETNKKTARAVARALKPGGRFVVEVLNRDYLIADLPSRVWWEGDGCVVLEEVEFNYFSSRIVSSRSVVFDDGRQLEQEISLRAYSLHELGKLLHAAGFRILEISGSMETKGRFFGNQSREILVVCQKRATKSNGGETSPPALPVADDDDNGSEGTLPGTGGDDGA